MTPDIRMSSIDQFLVILPSIVFEALPFIIVGALISGTLEELLPQQLFARMIPKRRSVAIAGSALLGLIFPMCECGIVPVMRRLLGKGLPVGCAVAYMLAAPIINPVVLASTWAAFSGDRAGLDNLTSYQMVVLRTGAAFLTAFIVGSLINRLAQTHGTAALIRPIQGKHAHGHSPASEARHDVASPGSSAEQPTSWGQRLRNISDVALHDFVDITCFLILGAVLASVVQTFRVAEFAPSLVENPVSASLYMMVLAFVICLCSEADAFVAANMIKVPLAGKLSFLVLGPMLDLKLYLMYTRVFRRRLIWSIIPAVVACVFCFSLLAHYLDQAARATAP